MTNVQAERLFQGPIAEEYEMLQRICPAVLEVSQNVGTAIKAVLPDRHLNVLEIGCGTGITTLRLLEARPQMSLLSIDNEPAMIKQTRVNLAEWINEGRVKLDEADALTALSKLPAASLDVVASGYAIHNFLQGYRREVLKEVFRVLKPGGFLINGDRYALDDGQAHTQATQEEVRFWFKAFAELGRYDLLEHWIVHLFSDESADHLMRFSASVDELKDLGFARVEVPYRDGVNTLIIASKTCLS